MYKRQAYDLDENGQRIPDGKGGWKNHREDTTCLLYTSTDYGPNNDGVTDYNDTDYGPNSDGVTDYNDTNYGDTNYDDGGSDYSDSDDDGDSGYDD